MSSEACLLTSRTGRGRITQHGDVGHRLAIASSFTLFRDPTTSWPVHPGRPEPNWKML
jgi:hypothetical protein